MSYDVYIGALNGDEYMHVCVIITAENLQRPVNSPVFGLSGRKARTLDELLNFNRKPLHIKWFAVLSP